MASDVEVVIECDPFHGISSEPYEKKKAKKRKVKDKSKVQVKAECDDCGGVFKSKWLLKVHWNKEHLPKNLVCPDCKRSHKSYNAFAKHMNHRATCINTAKVRVEGEGRSRIFYCKECSFKTPRIQQITIHINVHTGVRPFQCTMCEKGYTQLSGLQAHMEYSHQQIVKEITCEHCGIMLRGRYSWSKHMRIHRTEKFPCPICNRLYASKYILKWHMQRHSGIKNYACDICAKTFSVSSDLRTHKVKVHFKSQMFSCVQCVYKPCICNVANQPVVAANSSSNDYQTLVKNEQQPESNQFGKNVQCMNCSKCFYSKKSMAAHKCEKQNVDNAIKNESVDKVTNNVVSSS